jgi:hypothetical protein
MQFLETAAQVEPFVLESFKLNLILFKISGCLHSFNSFSLLIACAYVKHVIAGNLHTRLRKREVTGGHRLEEYQDHPLDLGLGLRTCHLGAADK